MQSVADLQSGQQEGNEVITFSGLAAVRDLHLSKAPVLLGQRNGHPAVFTVGQQQCILPGGAQHFLEAAAELLLSKTRSLRVGDDAQILQAGILHGFLYSQVQGIWAFLAGDGRAGDRGFCQSLKAGPFTQAHADTGNGIGFFHNVSPLFRRTGQVHRLVIVGDQNLTGRQTVEEFICEVICAHIQRNQHIPLLG